jgi:hypothetical protein
LHLRRAPRPRLGSIPVRSATGVLAIPSAEARRADPALGSVDAVKRQLHRCSDVSLRYFRHIEMTVWTAFIPNMSA